MKVRIVNGPVATSAFVRYYDREEAESAKNLIRSYCPEYKTGWGKGMLKRIIIFRNCSNLCTFKGVGVTKDEFDTRAGKQAQVLSLNSGSIFCRNWHGSRAVFNKEL